MNTEAIFNNPLATDDIGDVGKGRFTVKRRIPIASIHPRQTMIDDLCLADKVKGKYHTEAFVVITKDKNILIDGHHTVAAKKINGQKYIMAKCYLFN